MNLAQTGLLDLIIHAGLVVKLVLLSLLGASVFCWAIVFNKTKLMKKVSSSNQKFLTDFWQSKSIEEIYDHLDKYTSSPVAAVFKSGVKELKKITSTGDRRLEPHHIDNISRALFRASATEVANLERLLTWLATTASSAPFVGLFGTVWGIMTSFQGIGATGSANLAVVAPGISEALIATAAGLACAIPAVITYNHFIGKIKRTAVEIDTFIQDFLNIIQRSILANQTKRD